MLAGLGAFQRERYRDAVRILRTVVHAVPAAPSPRELLGLGQYHLGQWRAARATLEAAAELSGSVDQHPVIMDCERALGRRRQVEARFEEMRRASPEAEVLSEGRLVLAGALADAGDLRGATELLVAAGAGRHVRNPAPRHLRQWYVLADLAERGGELARARELFGLVAVADPDAYDVSERLAQLGAPAPARAGRSPQRRRKPGQPGR
jgi:tetratricopeptide (TPR) repeat protein